MIGSGEEAILSTGLSSGKHFNSSTGGDTMGTLLELAILAALLND